MARSITTRRPLWVQEVDFDDGTIGYATDGTPVDCVRLARLGLIEGFEAELVVSGINHGSNLGDDITYSGTVAAALEAIVLGLPGIAVSQQSRALELDFRVGARFEFDVAARFTARLVADLEAVPLPSGTLLNINVPGAEPLGVEVARLGQAHLPRRAVADRRTRAAGVCTGSMATRATSATRPAPTWPRSTGQDRGHADPLRSHRSRGHRCLCALTTWRVDRRRPRARSSLERPDVEPRRTRRRAAAPARAPQPSLLRARRSGGRRRRVRRADDRAARDRGRRTPSC